MLILALAAPPAQADTTVYIPGLGNGPESFAEIAQAVGGNSFNEGAPRFVPGQEDHRLTPDEFAADLHRRLIAAGKTPPYVVVGHSLGGGYALAFAALYPAETKALVLVDPRLPGFTSDCARAGLMGCGVPPSFYARLSEQQRAMLDGYDADPTPPTALGAVPVTILGATRPLPGYPLEWQLFWLKEQARYAIALKAGRMIPVAGGGHGLHKQFPGQVEAVIRAAWLPPEPGP